MVLKVVRLFTILLQFLNHLVIDHALRPDKMRKGLGRIDGINWDAFVRLHSMPFQYSHSL